jgi:predicted metal-binding membrane protein
MSSTRTPAAASALARQPAERSAVAAILVLCLASWAALVAEALRAATSSSLLAVLCGPSALQASSRGVLAEIPAVFGLWFVMSIAMMLPTSVPMVLGFVDALDERRMRGRAGLPLVLIAGYGLVWCGIAAGAAIIQAGLTASAARLALPPAAVAVLTGTVVGFAGLYQFSDLKMRFLASCRHPVPPLRKGEDGVGTVLRLGIDQAMRCAGCCAAVMALMLVAGMMNLAWMGIFALAMTVERIASGALASRLIGIAFIAGGAALAASGVGLDRILAAFLAR